MRMTFVSFRLLLNPGWWRNTRQVVKVRQRYGSLAQMYVYKLPGYTYHQ